MPSQRDSFSPSASVLSLLGLIQGHRNGNGRVENGNEMEKLEKRRATNRSSQRKARDRKEGLIKSLQEENERLKQRLDTR